MSPTRARREPRTRTRTFAGCLTCRNRKVKCDTTRPKCRNCTRLKLDCRGYQSALHWMPPWSGTTHASELDSGDDHSRMRTELFPVTSRQHMSARLVAQVDAAVDQTLIDLDARTRQIAPTTSLDWFHQKGPFGVFPSIAMHASPEATESMVGSSDLSCLQAISEYPPGRSDEDAVLNIWNDVGDLLGLSSELGPFDILSNPSALHESSPQQDLGVGSWDGEPFISPSNFSDNPMVASDLQPPASFRTVIPSPYQSNIPEPTSPRLPRSARFLLWHYATCTIPSLMSIPVASTDAPWNDLHLPCALTAYSELDVLGDSSLARVSLLYSLFSISCYQLSNLHADPAMRGASPSWAPNTMTKCYDSLPQSSTWEVEGRKFRRIAQSGFRRCLQSLSKQKGPRVKFKEVLMAAISLVCIGIVSGDTEDARWWILHCEHIIRKLGTPDLRNSQKFRILHRMFLFIGVLEETSFAQDLEEYERVTESNARADDGILVEHLPNIDYAQYLSRIIDRGPMDHFDLSRSNDMMHEEVYALPPALLGLIARTTSLIDEMQGYNSDDLSPLPIPLKIERKAIALENDICACEADYCHRSGTGTGFPSLHQVESHAPEPEGLDVICTIMRDSTMAAMYYAVLLYFFRSIRQTNPVILQHYVETVVDKLETHTRYKMRFSTRLNVIVWPSFIAACEAISSDLRSRSLACLRQASWAGFRNWERAEDVAKEVWRRRDAGEKHVSWQSVVRDMNVIMVLT